MHMQYSCDILKKGGDMEVTGWNTQECLAPLQRCNLDGQRSAARADRGVPAAPLERVTPSVLHSRDHVQKSDNIPMMAIKMESNSEDTDTMQVADVGLECLWEDSSVLAQEVDDFVMKTENETAEVTVKQELDIEPTVLQPQIAPRPFPLLSQASLDLDQRLSTISRNDANLSSVCTTLTRPASGTEVGNDYREENFGVPSNVSFVLATRRADSETIVRKGSDDRSDSEGMPLGARDRDQHRDFAKLQAECNCKRYVLRTEGDTRTDGKHNKCDYCKYSSSRKSNFISRILTHTQEKLYTCEQCEYSASQLNTLKSHMRTHTSEKPYKCDHCKYSASRLNNLKVHMRTHTGEKPYQCDHCEYSASRLNYLKAHIRTHTREKPYKCEQCEYSASQLYTLKRHMRTHTGEKPYQCEQCEYSASQLNRLKEHMRTHTREKPYQCDHCEYSASRLINLKAHMHTHTGEKPYKCEQCEYSASHLHSLKVHMRVHTGEKPYKCEQCEYSASHLHTLKRHMHTHMGEKSYQFESSSLNRINALYSCISTT